MLERWDLRLPSTLNLTVWTGSFNAVRPIWAGDISDQYRFIFSSRMLCWPPSRGWGRLQTKSTDLSELPGEEGTVCWLMPSALLGRGLPAETVDLCTGTPTLPACTPCWCWGRRPDTQYGAQRGGRDRMGVREWCWVRVEPEYLATCRWWQIFLLLEQVWVRMFIYSCPYTEVNTSENPSLHLYII